MGRAHLTLDTVREIHHVVRFLGAVDDPEMSLCLRFELYLEKDFSERLKKRRALTVDVCKFFGRQSVQGLAHSLSTPWWARVYLEDRRLRVGYEEVGQGQGRQGHHRSHRKRHAEVFQD
ncbi:hypothetical protein BGX23_000912 [Mortierella sp. AD031]|nr:hypothetical protein BGX23_000912 [Mortierella sp. AD031]